MAVRGKPPRYYYRLVRRTRTTLVARIFVVEKRAGNGVKVARTDRIRSDRTNNFMCGTGYQNRVYEKCTYLERSDPVASKLSSGSLTSGFRTLPRWRRYRSHDDFGRAGEPNAHCFDETHSVGTRNTKDELFYRNINNNIILFTKTTTDGDGDGDGGVQRRTAARKLKHQNRRRRAKNKIAGTNLYN